MNTVMMNSLQTDTINLFWIHGPKYFTLYKVSLQKQSSLKSYFQAASRLFLNISIVLLTTEFKDFQELPSTLRSQKCKAYCEKL